VWPNDPSFLKTPTAYSGLGWSSEAARRLVEDLILYLVKKTGGGILGGYFPDGNPPLDHEDGMVYGLCRALAREDPLAEVFCVTHDRGFLDAGRKGMCGQHSRVISPARLVLEGRRASTQAAIRRMRRG